MSGRNGTHIAVQDLRISAGRGRESTNTFHLATILTALIADRYCEATRETLQAACAVDEVLITAARLTGCGDGSDHSEDER